ncbi:MAG: PepSY-like domain-containing protein [Bacteroidales bacterium]|nr:PepSY-like domain-containing protein [Bacteroides sp.]MCM1198050.1 PepSY-like domain-containing protein [Clostridium sp.]MCM1501634.1 PepSY-like domain-containing protein [Bacteroidales bacterium]
MNRIFTFVVLMLAFAGIAKADDKPISFEQLPLQARNFIQENFPDETLMFAAKDIDFAGTSYDVRFSSGLKLEFNSKGEWKEIESKYSAVDVKFIPVQIRKYVDSRWTGVKYRKIEKKRNGGYEVKLANGLEVEFDRNFNVIDIDD